MTMAFKSLTTQMQHKVISRDANAVAVTEDKMNKIDTSFPPDADGRYLLFPKSLNDMK